MKHEDHDDPLLARLLSAVRADADPVLWTRVRARAAAQPSLPGWLVWTMRPAALATSFALLLGTAALALTLGGSTTAVGGDEYATLGEALLAERDAETTVSTAPITPAPGPAADDSGTGR